MLLGFAYFFLSALDEPEIVVSIAGVFVAAQCLREMILGLSIFTAAIVREAQCDVRRRETGISFQRLSVGGAGVALPALLIERQPLDVSLLGAGRTFRVGDGPPGRLEIRITIRRRKVVIANQQASVFALKANCYWRRKRILNRQRDRGGKGLGGVEINPLS